MERGFSNEAYAKGRIAFQNTPNVIDVYSQPNNEPLKTKREQLKPIALRNVFPLEP